MIDIKNIRYVYFNDRSHCDETWLLDDLLTDCLEVTTLITQIVAEKLV